uniref:uncharacterized protein LOC109973680 n=1 Tax=Monopterus albus TaxID=43700 RepID=UPI0009B4B758|nr:uncharacterized protein LOC109973680 [Monopterus albus]
MIVGSKEFRSVREDELPYYLIYTETLLKNRNNESLLQEMENSEKILADLEEMSEDVGVLGLRITSLIECLTKYQVLNREKRSMPFKVPAKALIAELVLEIIQMLTHKWLIARINNKDRTFEQLRTRLSKMLTRIFSNFMNGKKLSASQQVSVSNLVRLIHKETRNVLLRVHPDKMKDSKPYLICALVRPDVLNEMIFHVSTVLEGASELTCRLCRPDSPRIHPFIYLKKAFHVKRTQAIGEKLCLGLGYITETLLRDVPDLRYKRLHLDCSQKIKAVAEDISQLTAEQVQSLKDSVAAGQSPEHLPEWPTVTVEGIEVKTRNLFSKLFARTLIYRILAQLKKSHPGYKAKCSKSIQSLVDEIDTLIFMKKGEEDILIVTKKFGYHRCHEFNQVEMQLSDVFYKHMTGRKKPLNVPKSLAALYGDIENKMHFFLTLIVWWMDSQASNHSKELTCDIMQAVERASLFTGELSESEDPGDDESSQWQDPVYEIVNEPSECEALVDGEPSQCEDPVYEIVNEPSECEALVDGEPSQCEDPVYTIVNELSECEHTAHLATGETSECKNMCAEPVEDITVQVDQKKAAVRILVENLLRRTARKVKRDDFRFREDLIENLLEQIWVEVKAIDFSMSKRTLNILSKKIYKDIYKTQGSPTAVLVAMLTRNTEIKKAIVSSIRKHMTAAKPCTISTFFSSVGRAISRCFTFKKR